MWTPLGILITATLASSLSILTVQSPVLFLKQRMVLSTVFNGHLTAHVSLLLLARCLVTSLSSTLLVNQLMSSVPCIVMWSPSPLTDDSFALLALEILAVGHPVPLLSSAHVLGWAGLGWAFR
jgi:hypothetical protein